MRNVSVTKQAKITIEQRSLATSKTPVLLMVSGGCDSVALTYIACELANAGVIGKLALFHLNHNLRRQAADEDEKFVEGLANLLGIKLFKKSVNVAEIAEREHGNVEAVGRRERYLAANAALEKLCANACCPTTEGRIFTAHTADDRVENFYMRAMVGTGPGGLRSMKYINGPVARPLLDVSKQALKRYLEIRKASGKPCAQDGVASLWREDATNAHTDYFRAYVRHEVLPHVKKRAPKHVDVLVRTMNLIADEDDMLEAMAHELLQKNMHWEDESDAAAGGVLAPELGQAPRPLVRRVVLRILAAMLPNHFRIDAASVEAIVSAWDFPAGQCENGCAKPHSGYTANICGDIAVSANKCGVRLEPMAAYRARRKRDRKQ